MTTADFASYGLNGSRGPKEGVEPVHRPRPTVQPHRISDWVYDQLCDAIRTVELAPGAPLSEPSLATHLNVSRAPIREALTRLADQRLITVVPQVGTRVAPILMPEVEEACFIRSALECGAFHTVITTPGLDTRPLRHALERNIAAAEEHDAEAFFESDEELHQTIFALAGVPHVWDVLRGIKLHLDRLRRLHLPDAVGNPALVAEHTAIVEAVEARDEKAGLDVIRRHANRILADSGSLRTRYPDYFEG
ncbi:GntR family transcriptional regulator [Diaminobutyricibacter tongyongensis]|uniref:GntR family transcriptional regulator n=1 Tax=Leifsonia tongyongensis TaxID=1268043 RepID=A0A6L9XVN4_9MICO|nr:GntR family transcriptional regulator [Diaminobutyricibacter tongyongensis]NEN05094.1 GntR family transcriptional regulator [Diaminobutyricibacter tongyongensis]